METGRITKLVSEKEYGSITTHDGREAHFHKQCLWEVDFKDLKIGQEVECYVKNVMNGYLAIEIRPRQNQVTELSR